MKKLDKLSISFFIISIIILLLVAVGLFTFIPDKVHMNLSQDSELKPSFYLLFLAILPIASNYIINTLKQSKIMNIFFFILIYVLLFGIILTNIGISIPITNISISMIIIVLFSTSLYLYSLKEVKKYAITLSWVKTEEGYFKVQKRGAILFFIASLILTFCFILYSCNILSINLTLLIPGLSFFILLFIFFRTCKNLN